MLVVEDVKHTKKVVTLCSSIYIIALEDLKLVDELSKGKVDLTFGSALDIFGGKGVTFAECVAWNSTH
jgi:phosphoribosylformimino-5-aminoimidazole carboxamide ribonucleotide (ProFAR) isomerase